METSKKWKDLGWVTQEGEITQMNKVSNERGDITVNTLEIQKGLRGYHEQLCAKKSDKLEEIDTVLQMYNLPILNLKEIGNLNARTLINV